MVQFDSLNIDSYIVFTIWEGAKSKRLPIWRKEISGADILVL